MADVRDEVDTTELESPAADTHHATYDDSTDESLLDVVVGAIATVNDCDPLEVDPLYHAIDPEALEALFASGPEGPRYGVVTFTVDGLVVSVTDGRRVTVEPAKR